MPPKDDLLEVILSSIKSLPEKSVIVITSKIVSIWQGRCVPASKVLDKDILIMTEADYYLPREFVPGKWVMHTMKEGLLIPTSGIDESNADKHLILWPEKIEETARFLHRWLQKKYKLKNVGVLITDSHSIPLRRGVVGISLAHFGFDSLKDYRQKHNLFGKQLKISQTNIPDALAAAAVFAMGEGNEQTPLAVISDIKGLKFRNKPFTSKKPFSSFKIGVHEDLYGPFINSAPWKKGGALRNSSLSRIKPVKKQTLQ